MCIGRRVVAHSPEAVSLKNLKRLQVYRSLAPGATGIDLDALVVNGRRRVDPYAELRHVLHGQEPALALNESDDFFSDFPFVEEIARSLESGFPPLPSVVAFDLDQSPEGAGQVLLNENVAYFGAAAARKEHGCGGRPSAIAVGVTDERVASVGQRRLERCRDGEATLGQLKCRGYHLLERHCAIEPERSDPGVCRRWRHCPQYPGRQLPAAVLDEMVDTGGFWPAAQPADGPCFASGCIVDNDRGDAAKSRPLRKRHVYGDTGGYARVCGVATLLENAEASSGGQVVAAGNHVIYLRSPGDGAFVFPGP